VGKLVVLVLLLAAAVALYYLQLAPSSPVVTLDAPGGKLSCQVASTEQAREAGLSNRTFLCPNCCLLFEFEEPGRPGFWMKDMKFALDIVFLDANYSVVDLWQNAVPCTPQECQLRYPRADSKYVVEVNAGRAAELGLEKGARAVIAG